MVSFNLRQPSTAKLNLPGNLGASIDINAAAGDCNRSVYAPGKGSVKKVRSNTDGWGNAIVWTSSGGNEKIFVAHLSKVTKTGAVNAGDKIAQAGATGKMDPSNVGDRCNGKNGAHLHVNRTIKRDGRWKPAGVQLNGLAVATYKNYWSRGAVLDLRLGYTSGIERDEPSRNAAFTHKKLTGISSAWGNDFWWTKSANDGELGRWNFTGLTSGKTYRVYCAIPGHPYAWGKVRYRAWAPVVGGGAAVTRDFWQKQGWGWLYIGKVTAREGKIRVSATDVTSPNGVKLGLDACKARG